MTSSAEPGMLSVLQLAGVSQLLSPPAPVHATTESNVLGSIHSIRGRHDFDRFGLRFDCDRKGSANMAMTSRDSGCSGKPKIGDRSYPQSANWAETTPSEIKFLAIGPHWGPTRPEGPAVSATRSGLWPFFLCWWTYARLARAETSEENVS